MAVPSGSIYEVRWNELCPWLVLAKAWRVSLLVRVLAYAWLGLLLTQLGWRACERLWSESVGTNPASGPALHSTIGTLPMDLREHKASERRLLASSLFRTDFPRMGNIDVRMDRSAPHPLLWLREHWRRHPYGPLVEGWRALNLPFIRVFQLDTAVSDTVRFLLCGLWAVAVWAMVGGAIACTSARYCTREEIITPIAAGRAAAAKWLYTAAGPLLPLLFTAALMLPVAVLGLMLRADFLAMVAGFLWLPVLLWGLVIAIVLIAVWFGWPLMWATIAVERSDAFDAAARTAAYIYQRPLRLAFYVIVATVLGMVGQLIVSGFVAAADHLTEWATSWGAGVDRVQSLGTSVNDGVEPTSSGSFALASQSIAFWKHMLVNVAAAYPLAYLFSTSVGIYLLLRLDVDSTEMDEIADDMDKQPHAE